MAEVVLDAITKRFGRRTTAVRVLSFEAAEGELTVLLGPSGCGKTTTLRLIAGLERPDDGRIQLEGRVINDLPPFQREVALVFQDSALYPHLSVRKNLQFPLKQRGIDTPEIDRRIDHAAQVLSIEHLLNRKPGRLSGGERQRAALGRLIVLQPAVSLLDEPFNQLDASLRRVLRGEIKLLQRQLKQTMIFVTHDQHEAMALADRIVVMHKGAAAQIGSPHAVYDHPADRFVAQFIGEPPMNLLHGEIQSVDGRPCFVIWPDVEIPLPQRFETVAQQHMGQSVVLGIRPGDLAPCEDEAGATPCIRLDRAEMESTPQAALLQGRLSDGQRVCVHLSRGDLEAESTAFRPDPQRIHLFEADLGGRRLTPDTRPI